MGKIDFWPLLIKYIDTLRNYQTNKISLIDIFVQLIVPALLSVALFFKWPDSRINLGDLISNLISCISIISGLMCAVAVLLFQLRLQMSSQKDPKPLDREFVLVDESFHILCGLFWMGSSLLVCYVWPHWPRASVNYYRESYFVSPPSFFLTFYLSRSWL